MVALLCTKYSERPQIAKILSIKGERPRSHGMMEAMGASRKCIPTTWEGRKWSGKKWKYQISSLQTLNLQHQID